MRNKALVSVTLVFLMIGWAGRLDAQDLGTHTRAVPDGAVRTPDADVEPYGVAVSPAIYLVNFLLLYFSSPDVAADMPAYRAPLPQEVYACLVENPHGCHYPDMAPYFAEQALETGGRRNRQTFWPIECQIDQTWQKLAPPEFRGPQQINQPLGRKKADSLARFLGIGQDMILTDVQYRCMTGVFPRSDEHGRETIRRCLYDLTNSKGSAVVPLSSYGLSLDEEERVRSNCAPDAPCLDFNQLAVSGDLLAIAVECGFPDKLANLFAQTPLWRLANDGVACQETWAPPCIVETVRPGCGGRPRGECAPPGATGSPAGQR